MDKNLRSESIKTYSKNKVVAWVLGIFLAIFVALITLLSMLIPYISILAIPFLILPFLFASQVAYIDTYNGNQLTFRSFFSFFFSFFKGGNSGSYMFLRSFFKSLAFFGATYLLSSVAGSIFIYCYDKEGTMKIAEIIQQMMLTETYAGKTLEEVMGAQYTLFNIFQNIILIPTVIVFTGSLLYFIIRNSICVYLRMHFPGAVNVIYRDIFNNMMRANRKQFLKDFFYLNWPMFAIYLGVNVVAVTLCLLFLSGDGYTILPISIASSIALLMFFLPFYFSNQMALFTKYHEEFKKANEAVKEKILNQLQKQYEEEKALEEQLQRMAEEVNRLKAEEEKKKLEQNQEENQDNPEDEK